MIGPALWVRFCFYKQSKMREINECLHSIFSLFLFGKYGLNKITFFYCQSLIKSTLEEIILCGHFWGMEKHI